MSWTILFVLLSKVPIFIYVMYKAWKYRNSIVVVSSIWLGLLAFASALSSLTVATITDKLFAGVVGYTVVFSLFMIAYTAKEGK